VHEKLQGLGSRPFPASLRFAVYGGGCALFVIILFLRGGPNPAETDAHAVTLPTTAISHGDLGSAERDTLVPNPPGYPLLMAPFVIALRPWIGSPQWCDSKPVPTLLRGPGDAYYRSILGICGTPQAIRNGEPLPHWYRSQALLAILGWIVLVAGAVMLLRSTGAGRGTGEAFLVFALAVLPASSDAIVQSFHPQDLVCVGFACAGISQALRRRWLLVGVLFGVAFLCKQFAILPLLAVLAAAPGWRARVRTLVPATGIVALGVLPFYLADSVDTVRALSAVYVAGVNVVKSPTGLGLLDIGETLKLEIARDAPIVAATGMVLWARWRARGHLLAPTPLIGLALACLATRLIFEVSILNYYFVAVGVVLLVLDCARKRPPVWSVVWIVATRYGLTWMAPVAPSVLTAITFLVASLVPIGLGLNQVVAERLPSLSVRPSRPLRGKRLSSDL
jgi:hypothetical protein